MLAALFAWSLCPVAEGACPHAVANNAGHLCYDTPTAQFSFDCAVFLDADLCDCSGDGSFDAGLTEANCCFSCECCSNQPPAPPAAPPPSPSNPPPPSPPPYISPGALAGIVIGAIVGVLLLVAIAMRIKRDKRLAKPQRESSKSKLQAASPGGVKIKVEKLSKA